MNGSVEYRALDENQKKQMLRVEAWLPGPAESVSGILVKHSDLLLGFLFCLLLCRFSLTHFCQC